MKRSVAIAVGTAMLALAAWAPGVAMAATTLVVDDDGMASAASCGDATPAYATIQAAVDAAAPGDTVKVCPGTYVEAVTVNKQLTLLGPTADTSQKRCPSLAGLATVTSDADDYAFSLNADRVVLKGFHIHDTGYFAIYTNPLFSGYLIRNNTIENNAIGIYLNADGDIRSLVRNNCIRDNNATVNNPNPVPTAGTGIYTDQGLRNASISGNGFRNHLNLGVNLASTAGVTDTSNIILTYNVSRNDRTFLAVYNARKVWVGHNKVRQDAGGQDWNGSAIYIGGGSDVGEGDGARSVTLAYNSIVSTQLPHGFFSGIAVRADADGVLLTNNTIRGTFDGISVTATTPGAVFVRNNRVYSVHQNGIAFEQGTSENQIWLNQVYGSALYDCFDGTTGPEDHNVANSWHGPGPSRNIGATSSPAGLCFPN